MNELKAILKFFGIQWPTFGLNDFMSVVERIKSHGHMVDPATLVAAIAAMTRVGVDVTVAEEGDKVIEAKTTEFNVARNSIPEVQADANASILGLERRIKQIRSAAKKDIAQFELDADAAQRRLDEVRSVLALLAPTHGTDATPTDTTPAKKTP